MSKIAIYGKGGIGKSTISANLSAAMASKGHKVLQIGCDPKHDSTKLLLHGKKLTTALDYMRDVGPTEQDIGEILEEGYLGIGCIEAGGPRPGVGCAGRGIISTFDMLERFRLPQKYDTVIYDVLGDVVCGGFAVPIRREYADYIFIVTSGEFMSLYAANNILRGIQNYDGDIGRVAGIIYNKRNIEGEDSRVERFAEAVNLPVIARIPRDDVFTRAEAERITAFEMCAGDEVTAVFKNIANSIDGDPELYKALPVTDEELERCIANAGSTKKNDNDVHRKNKNEKHGETPANPVNEPANIGNEPENVGNEPVYYYSKSLKNSEPLHGCAFNGALSTCVHVRGAIILAHAPKSCAYISFQTISSSGRRRLFERGSLLPVSLAPDIECTDMGETEIVFGGMERLEEKIEELKEKKPEAIVVISGCPAGITGDDISKAERLSDENTRVISLKTDGNMAGDYLQGMIMAYTTLARAFVRKDIEPDNKYVNIIAEKIVLTGTEENFRTMERYLKSMGLLINCRFLYDTDTYKLRNLKRGGINIPAYGDYAGRMLGDFLHREYGMHMFEKPFPVGFDSTCDWLRTLGRSLGKEARVEEIISAEREKYVRKINEIMPVLKGKKLMVITYNHELDWILKTADDAGMEIVKIGILNFSQDEGFRTNLSLKCPVEENYDKTKRMSDIDKYKPDVLLTNYASSVAEKVAVADTIPMCPYVGFESGIEMLKRWAELLRLDRKGEWNDDAVLFDKYYS